MSEESPESRRKPKPLPSSNVANLWERQLLRSGSDNGKPGPLKKCSHNIAMILTSEDDWRGAIGFDAFAERIMIRRACPAGEPGPWNDLADLKAANWLQQSRWKLDVSAPKVSEAVPEAAHRCTFHPLRDKLNSLRWDAVPRLATWLSVYLGAEDTPVHRAIASTWMLGAVSRAFSPGCQVDAALVLEGIQGAGKSSALRTLALGFFTDELADIGSKDAAMQLHGAWIVELSELDALSRAEVTRVKSFITRRVERFRAPYGRHIAEHPRSCVFAGTTNQSDYLRDDSGNRRWLPVLCGPVRLDELRRDVDLLWAEAVILYRDNGDTYIKDPSLLRDLRIHTDKRYQGDAWTDVVLNYANARESVSVGEVLEHVGVDRGRWSRSDETRVAKILKSEGFERHRATVGEARQWRYFRDYNGRALDGLGR